MNPIHARPVTDPNKDDIFLEIVNDSTKTPIAVLEKNENNQFTLSFLSAECEVDAIEFIKLLQKGMEEL